MAVPAFKMPRYAQNNLEVIPTELDILKQAQQQQMAPDPLLPPETQEPLPVYDTGVAVGTEAPVEVPTQRDISSEAQPPVEGDEESTTPVPPKDDLKEQERALNRMLMDKAQESIGEQRRGISENEAEIEGLKNMGGGLDLSPLLALTDTWTGSNLVKSYSKPKTEEDRKKELIQLKAELQKQRGILSDREIDLIKSQISGKKQDRSDRIISDKLMSGFTTPLKDMDKVGAGISRLESAFKPDKDGYISANRITSNLVQYVRSISGDSGPLSDNDVARSNLITVEKRIADLQGKFGTDGRILWTDPSVKSILENIAAAKKYSIDGYRNKINTTKSFFDVLPAYQDQAEAVGNLHKQGLASLDRAFATRDYLQQAEETLKSKHSKKQDSPKKGVGKAPSDTAIVEHNGQRLSIPRSRLSDALKDGAKEIQ